MDANDDTHKILYLHLVQELRILHLVYHRNKNQHQRSHWWKRLNMLKRNCNQVVGLLAVKRVENVKDLSRLYKLLNGFINKQSIKTYHDFNSVIALGQFVSLGVILIGILARIYAIYRKLLEIYESKFKDSGFIRVPSEKPIETNQFMESLVQEELGEVVPIEPKTTKSTAPENNIPKKESSKRKKKKKSTIDSIFG